MNYGFLNGKIAPVEKLTLPVNDLGVLRGYGVFDFLKTVNGRPLLWAEHWRRFQNSAKALGLKIPAGEKRARQLVGQLLKKSGRRPAAEKADASIRLLLTGGPSADGLTPVKPSFGILIEDIHPWPKKALTHGVKVITHEHLRLVPEAKTTNYLTAVRLQKEKRRAGAVEILYTHRGRLLECSTSNFFIVKNGRLITPKTDILYGTMRNLVVALAKATKIPVEEREVMASELRDADEGFLTATNKNLTPVVQVDERKINRGEVGPVTRDLATRLTAVLAKN